MGKKAGVCSPEWLKSANNHFTLKQTVLLCFRFFENNVLTIPDSPCLRRPSLFISMVQNQTKPEILIKREKV